MKLTDLFIRRPVLATVVNVVVILIGFVCYQRLAVREYPNIDMPVVTVETTYTGANASIMETQVTKPIEDALSGIEGIDFIKSISRSETSQITVQFRLTRDPESATSDVRDKVGRVRGILPDEVDEPVIAKVEADAQPIIWLALSSDTIDPMEVSETADITVQDRLQILPGVASVRLVGERRPSMRIWLNPEKLGGYNMTPQDVETALLSQNVEIPAGRVESQMREFTVLAQTDLNTPEEFNNIIVRADPTKGIVHLSDVARVEVAPLDERQIARFNGKDAVALGVVKQSTANPLDISKAIQVAMPEIQKLLPSGMKLGIAYDSSVFIDQSIKNVYHTIGEAVLLVVIVIFLFLRSGRATLIPLVTIPVSLIGAVALMYMMNFTINTLTLLSAVIAIGLVVDDAIVVLENIYRHIENGMDPLHAAVKGSREIIFAVIAMTLTLAAVFAPISFTPGRTGKLFIEFALTLAGAVIVSGFTALTLTPMMCSKLLQPHQENEARWSVWIDNRLKDLERNYKYSLTRIIRFRFVMIGLAVALVAWSAFLLVTMPNALTPVEDRGVIFGIGIAPEGSTIQYSDQYAKQMQAINAAVPEHAWDFLAIGFPFITQTFGVTGLVPWEERHRSTTEIIQSLFPQYMGIKGTMNFPINPPSLGQSASSRPVEFIIQTTGGYAELNEIVNKTILKMAANPGIIQPDSDLKLNKPELHVSLDRAKLALMGVQVAEVGHTLETMLGGKQITRFKRKGEQYDVMVKIEDDARRTPTELTQIYVRSMTGEMVPLSNLVHVEENVAPRELNHFNKLRAATITAMTAPGVSLGKALDFMEQTVHEVAPEANVDYGGVSREFKESSANMGTIFALALAFIYLVLAAQFESFVDPIIILLTVPLATAGAATAMALTGGSLNVYSQIGLVALIGLISKHGILIVEFANQLQEKGRGKVQAAIEAASLRLRPILMTTGAMVLGSLPLAISHGAGAESRQAIGWVLVGGMSFGTMMTLFVVPLFYILLHREHKLAVFDEALMSGDETHATDYSHIKPAAHDVSLNQVVKHHETGFNSSF